MHGVYFFHLNHVKIVEWLILHTFATIAIKNGVNVKALSDILGHATVQITMNLYCHSSLDLMRDSINKIAGLFL